MEPAAARSTLPRAERLRGKRAIDALFAGGRSGFVHPFRFVWSATGESVPNAVLVVAPKRNHKHASDRNLLKRRAREAYRLNKGLAAPAGLHIALIYSSKKIEDYKTIENAVRGILSKIAAEI